MSAKPNHLNLEKPPASSSARDGCAIAALSYQPFAYFSFNNGFGWLNPHHKLVFDNVGQLLRDTSGPVTHQQILTGRKMQQVAYQDYLNK
jgi:hypothetical protein